MTTDISWQTVAVRLAWTLLAGALIGINRGEKNRPAGLRTTMLVCLAASLSMIEVNLLLGTVGKASNSYVVLDLMRLPLGILSGMGFIGAGAILHKGELVSGVTTAATLWFVTMLGICFGGGQIVLGVAALISSLVILWGLKWVENHWRAYRHGALRIVCSRSGPTAEEVKKIVGEGNYEFSSWTTAGSDGGGEHRNLACRVRWKGPHSVTIPPFLQHLSDRKGVEEVEWKFESL